MKLSNLGHPILCCARTWVWGGGFTGDFGGLSLSSRRPRKAAWRTRLSAVQVCAEADLRDERGLSPRRALARFRRRIFERRGFLFQRLELVAEELVRLLREAGADAAGVDELLPFVVAEDERAHSAHACVSGAGQGVAADDEFLLVEALALDPVGAASGAVFGGGELGDDALGVQLACVVKECGAVGLHVLADAECVLVGGRKDFGEESFAVAQGLAASVVAVEVEEVEHEIGEVMFGAFLEGSLQSRRSW